MRYRVLIQRSAQKALDKLPDEIRDRVLAAILALSENPRPVNAKKLRDSDYWRIRVGDYRVVYEIDDEVRIVLVLSVGHRREVYR